MSAAFRLLGGEAYRVDWSDKVEAELHADVGSLSVEDVIILCDGVPDVVWASPQCTTYSIATHRHRTVKEGLKPKTELAAHDDAQNIKLWRLVDELIRRGTKYYFVENPRGRMRHMDFIKGRPRYTITYCSYGSRGNAAGYTDQYCMKPTDIWTNHPDPKFLPYCKDSHKHGGLGKIMKRDYLSRGSMPKKLTEHIANIMRS